MTKVKSKREVIQEAQKEQRTVHFASLMDICHLKNAELEPKIEKHLGWFPGIVCVSNDVRKAMDVAGQAAGAVSAYTKVKLEVQKCVERCCELANMKAEQLYKVSSPWLDDQLFKKEELDQLENYHKYAHKFS